MKLDCGTQRLKGVALSLKWNLGRVDNMWVLKQDRREVDETQQTLHCLVRVPVTCHVVDTI